MRSWANKSRKWFLLLLLLVSLRASWTFLKDYTWCNEKEGSRLRCLVVKKTTRARINNKHRRSLKYWTRQDDFGRLVNNRLFLISLRKHTRSRSLASFLTHLHTMSLFSWTFIVKCFIINDDIQWEKTCVVRRRQARTNERQSVIVYKNKQLICE